MDELWYKSRILALESELKFRHAYLESYLGFNPCSVCGGKGYRGTSTCTDCSGTGLSQEVSREEALKEVEKLRQDNFELKLDLEEAREAVDRVRGQLKTCEKRLVELVEQVDALTRYSK